MNTSFRTPKVENKITDSMWNFTINATEVLLAFTKAFIIVGGVLSAALADIVFGAISATILFGNNVEAFSNTPTWLIGGLISMATSAVQVIMWGVIERRGIGFKEIMKFNKLPRSVQGFLLGALFIWIFDDIMDVSPIFLLIKNSQYQTQPILYNLMVISVVVLVFIICSFSELLTGNLKSILSLAGIGNNNNQSTKPINSQPVIPSMMPKNSPVSQNKHRQISNESSDLSRFIKAKMATTGRVELQNQEDQDLDK